MICRLFCQILPIADNETGDHVSHHKEADDEVATNSSGSDLRIDITRATSLEVLVPKGSFILTTDRKHDCVEL